MLSALIFLCTLAAWSSSYAGPPALNSVDTVVSDMKRRNDFVLKDYQTFQHGWYVGPGETHMGNNPSFSNSPTWSLYNNNPAYVGKVAKAFLPWVVVFEGVEHAASNVAVEMRNMRTYVKSRATGQWSLLAGPAGVTGRYYAKPKSDLPDIAEVVLHSSRTATTIKVPESRHYWHGWWKPGRLSIDPDDIAALFVTVQARTVVADASKADDRARAQLGLQVGADYYLDKETGYKESYAPAVGISRTKSITGRWQAFSFATLSDVGSQMPGGGITEASFRAAPPPME